MASQSAAVRPLGVSHISLPKAQRGGRIASEADGGWDVDGFRARLAKSSDPVRKTAAFVATPPCSIAAPVMSEAYPLPALPGMRSTTHTTNEVLKPQKPRLRIDERRGELVMADSTVADRLVLDPRDAVLTHETGGVAERRPVGMAEDAAFLAACPAGAQAMVPATLPKDDDLFGLDETITSGLATAHAAWWEHLDAAPPMPRRTSQAGRKAWMCSD